MKFGPFPPDAALGATAVHTIREGALVLKKGTVIGPAHVAALKDAGIASIVVARLDPGDVSEDDAAAAIALTASGDGVRADKAFTGRCNLFADAAGVLVVDRDRIDALNRIDEAVTIATLPAYKPVVEGEMIATVKIIPFAVAGDVYMRAMQTVEAAKPLVRVAPYTIGKVGVVSTLLPGLSPKVVDKTLKITEERLAPAGARIVAERRVPHDQAALAAAIKDVQRAGAELVIVFGASAIADRRDVIPAAIEAVGGKIEHFGMPVDPGNLMLIGSANGRPVLGAPGCARSPKENGFDWVLMRLLAGLPVTRADITGMGVGGLLMEIVTRPQPREEPVIDKGGRFAAVDPRRRPLDPDGGTEQAAGAGDRQAAGANRRGSGTGVEGRAGGRRDRPPKRDHRRCSVRPAAGIHAQSGFCGRSVDLAAHGPFRAAGRYRRRRRDAGRHAAGRRRADRPADCGLRCPERRADCGAGDRWQARQSGAVVAALFPGIDDAVGRRRCPSPDREIPRGGGGSRR